MDDAKIKAVLNAKPAWTDEQRKMLAEGAQGKNITAVLSPLMLAELGWTTAMRYARNQLGLTD